MKALDFEYDGQLLSDYGFIVCSFDSDSGISEVALGANISFSKVSRNGGRKFGLTGTSYEECVTTTFDICKDPEKFTTDKMEITPDEFRDLSRWLNRREFLKYRTIEETDDMDYETCFFNASFNLSKLTIGETLYGIRLTMETDSPFGYGEEKTITWGITEANTEKIIRDYSNEVGYIYPKIEIKLSQDTDKFSISNKLDGKQICNMEIKNCSANEVITVDSETQIITSSDTNHKIYDDFNYEFFIIGNTFSNFENKITISSPCTITIKYCPVIKDIP